MPGPRMQPQMLRPLDTVLNSGLYLVLSRVCRLTPVWRPSVSIATAVEPVTQLKTRSAQLIRTAKETGQPIIITQNGRATAILQDVDSYQAQRDALLLLKFMAQGDQELNRGQAIGHSRIKRQFAERMEALAHERSI